MADNQDIQTQDPLKDLYTEFNPKLNLAKSFDEFKQTMSDPKNRESFFNEFNPKLNLAKNFNEFDSTLGMGGEKKNQVGNVSTNGSKNVSQLPSQSPLEQSKGYLDNSFLKNIQQPKQEQHAPKPTYTGKGFDIKGLVGNLDQQQPTDNTNVPKPNTINLKEQQDRALTNTAEKRLISNRKEVTPENIKKEKEVVQNLVSNGILGVTKDANDNLVYGMNPTIKQSFILPIFNKLQSFQDLSELAKAALSGNDELYQNTIEGQIKNKQKRKDVGFGDLLGMLNPQTLQMTSANVAAKNAENDEIPLSSGNVLNQATSFASGLAPDVLASAVPGIGTGLVFASTMGSEVPDKVHQLYQEKTGQYVNEGYDEPTAKRLAIQDPIMRDAIEQSIPSAATNAYLFSKTPVSKAGKGLTEALSTFSSDLGKVGQNSLKMGAIGGVSQGATEAIRGMQGYDTKDWVKNTLDAAGNYALIPATIEGLGVGAKYLPKYLVSAFKEYASQPEIKPIIEQAVMDKPNAAQILTDLDKYKQTTAPLRGVVSDDKMAAVGGRVEKISNLKNTIDGIDGEIAKAESSKSLLPTDVHKEVDKKINELNKQKEQIQSQIDDIDKENSTIIKSKEPAINHESDDITGDKLNENKTNEIQQSTETAKPIEEEVNKPIGETKETEPTGEGKVKPIEVTGTKVFEHGEDTKTADGLENGVKDSHLTDEGTKEANDIGKYIKDNQPETTRLEHSDVERAAETGKEVAKTAGIESVSNPLYRTADIGNFDGKKEGSFDEKGWTEGKYDNNKTVEPFSDFTDRMEKAYDHTKNELGKETVVITHSKVTRALQALESTDGKWTDETTKKYLDLEKEKPKEVVPSIIEPKKSSITVETPEQVNKQKGGNVKETFDKFAESDDIKKSRSITKRNEAKAAFIEKHGEEGKRILDINSNFKKYTESLKEKGEIIKIKCD